MGNSDELRIFGEVGALEKFSQNAKRIVVIGWPGAGKSVFSEKLSNQLNIGVFHLDALYWKTNHIPLEDKEWRLTHDKIASGKSWIIEGNYWTSLDIRIKASDCIIFFDLPMHVCARNVVCRLIAHYGKSRPGTSSGNAERFDRHFMLRMLRVLWIYPVLERGKTFRLIRSLGASSKLIVFHSQKEGNVFLESLLRTTKTMVASTRC